MALLSPEQLRELAARLYERRNEVVVVLLKVALAAVFVVAHKCYANVIAVALSVPDICACLECDPDQPIWATQDKYVAWCDANIGARFKNLTGLDLFRIRGGVVHRGHFDHPKSKFDRVMFIGPESQIKSHDRILAVAPDVELGGTSVKDLRLAGQILMLDVALFCRTIMDAARYWSIEKESDPFVRRNLPNLVRYRPEGLPPFSVGVPTVA
jgi:hypothetical protein